jgi:3'(2'), 5'-bisphosphate nucleotidase
MNPTLSLLCQIATEAAGVIRGVYDRPFTVDYKAPRDPVTDADRLANALICSRISDAFPGVPIVAEESEPSSFAEYRTSEKIFFVDPLDGTKEFVNKNGEFVIMIGLVEGAHATHGVVLAPAQRRLWAGFIGHGAFEMREDGEPKTIRVSETRAPEEARLVGSRSHRSPLLGRAVDALGSKNVLAVGSAGLKGARIATGAADVYLGPGKAGKRWDACAVDALVTAAGGRVTDAFGVPFDYRAPSLENERGILATNGRLHDVVIERIGEVIRGEDPPTLEGRQP